MRNPELEEFSVKYNLATDQSVVAISFKNSEWYGMAVGGHLTKRDVISMFRDFANEMEKTL